MRALILDPGAGRSALAGCRALGRRGWTVGIASPTATISARSRWARSFHTVPPADAGDFIDGVADAVRQGGFDIVLPAGDAETIALSAGRAAVPAVVPYPAHEVVLRAFDKDALTAVATRCGVAVPEAGGGRLPAVVKPRTHGHLRIDAVVVHTNAELADAVGRIEAAGGHAVVQERVVGELVAFTVVVDHASTVVAQAQQRALRVWPLEAGVSTRAVTTPIDASLAQGVTAIVRDLGWFGLAQFQFVVPPDGVPRLIDCNGRLYGSLALAEAAGADVVATWAGLALGHPTRPTTAAPGHRYQWLEGDMRRALAQRAVPLQTLAHAVGAVHSILRVDDPKPALAHLADLARRAARKGAQRWT